MKIIEEQIPTLTSTNNRLDFIIEIPRKKSDEKSKKKDKKRRLKQKRLIKVLITFFENYLF